MVMTKEEVEALYMEWCEENGDRMPNRVTVKMACEDVDNTAKGYQVDTIAIKEGHEGINTGDDITVLYFVPNLQGLTGLMEPGNGSGFVVLEVLEFREK